MKKMVLAVLTLVLGSTAASAQGGWAEGLFPDGITHNFGTVPNGSQLLRRFKMFNKYAVPLEISTRVGCHCITVTPSTSFVLKSRQEGYLDVTMDTRRLKGSGPRTINIYVTVGPEYVSSATLQVTANRRADVVLNPGELTFGVVQRGQVPPPQALDVEYAGVLDWRVVEVAKHTAPLDVTFKELYRRPGQVGYRVTMALKPDAPAGILKHEIFLKTNDPTSPLVPVLVQATIQASLSVVPGTVSLGNNLKVGESITKLVVVRGPRPFRVVEVEGQGDGISAELPAAATPVQLIKIKCQPDKAGELKRQLVIKTDLEQEAPLTVTVEGSVEPSGG